MHKIISIKKLKNHCWAVSIFEDEEEENSLDFDQGPIKGLTGRHWARKISSDYFLLSAANEPAQVFTQLLFKRSFETAETIWDIYSTSIQKPFLKYTMQTLAYSVGILDVPAPIVWARPGYQPPLAPLSEAREGTKDYKRSCKETNKQILPHHHTVFLMKM